MNPLTSVSTTTDPIADHLHFADESNAEGGAFAGFHLFSYILGALTATLFLGGSLFLLRKPEPPPIVLHPPPTPAPTSTPLPTATPAPMTVYVSGAVAYPGLYMLPADARVGEAIESAGGLAADADAIIVNQAEKLWDGAQVHVPSLAAVDAAPTTNRLGSSRMAEPPAGVSGSNAVAASEIGDSAGQGVNINSASATALETLPGIGPSKAQAIIENRPYATVDELERVPGIGAKTVEQLRELVVLQ